jgi:hypothetical protein
MNAERELSLETRIARSQDQESGGVDDAVVLLSITRGEYFAMNAVGGRIWSLIEQPAALGSIVDQLLTEFEVDRATCEREARAFVTALLEAHLADANDPNAAA